MPMPGNLKRDSQTDYQVKSVMFPWFPRPGRTMPTTGNLKQDSNTDYQVKLCLTPEKIIYGTAMPMPGNLKQDSNNTDYQVKFPGRVKLRQCVQYMTQPCQRQAI